MKVADMVIQAEYVARVFDGKKVVFVGDGDGIALSAAHLKAQEVISYGPKSITLLDFDERIVNSVRRFGEKLAPKIEITAHLYNVADPLPAEHFGAYDGFHINPPWGASNGGQSVTAFLNEAARQPTSEVLASLSLPITRIFHGHKRCSEILNSGPSNWVTS